MKGRHPEEPEVPEPPAPGGGPLPHYKHGGRRKHVKAAGRESRRRLDRGGRPKKWISGAIKHPGALHRQLGVPEGEKIPAAKLAKAAHSENPTLARRARLAETLKGFH